MLILPACSTQHDITIPYLSTHSNVDLTKHSRDGALKQVLLGNMSTEELHLPLHSILQDICL
jgi:hypothetical protein